MLPYERYEKILGILGNARFAVVTDLLKQLDCSMPTLQRDLVFLKSEGKIRRTHGGITLTDDPILNSSRSVYKNRESVCLDEKKRIGKAAQEFIEPNDVIFISHGTTTVQIARQIPVNHPLMVVTDGLDVAAALENHRHAQVVLVGSKVNYAMHHLEGAVNAALLARLNFSKFFIGTAGVSLNGGVSVYTIGYADFFRTILKEHHRVFVAADHTKLNREAPGKLVELSCVDTLITNRGADKKFMAECRTLGVNCILA
jgi:DeoR/GlpR family transcriptional regulator of sugar metabolism